MVLALCIVEWMNHHSAGTWVLESNTVHNSSEAEETLLVFFDEKCVIT